MFENAVTRNQMAHAGVCCVVSCVLCVVCVLCVLYADFTQNQMAHAGVCLVCCVRCVNLFCVSCVCAYILCV